MPWQVIMLAQNVFAAIFAIQSRVLTKKYPKAHFQIMAVIFTCLLIVSLPASLLVTNQSIHMETLTRYWFRLVGGGLLFGIWSVLSFKVFSYVDAAIATLLSTLGIVAVVIVSTFTIHEGLTARQMLGAAIILASMALVLSAHVNRVQRARWFMGCLLTVLASLTYGFAVANEKYLLNRNTVPSYVLFGFGLQLLPLLLVALIFGRSQLKLLASRQFLRSASAAGLVRGVAGFLFIISLVKANNSSLITVLSGLKVVLAAFLSYLLLREKQFYMRKIAAAGLAMLGIAIMLWR